MEWLKLLKALKEDEGLTLKNGSAVNYKTGWQVATAGHQTKSAARAAKLIKQYNGNCGIWFTNNIYYIDESRRVNTKKEALEIGRAHNQISIYGWAKGNLVYC